MYDIIVYHDKDGNLVMDVQSDRGVVILQGVAIPNQINLVDGDRHRHDGKVAIALNVEAFRVRGIEDFARRVNG